MSLGAIVDIVQTVAIIVLTVVVGFSFRQLERRLRLQHMDVQDTIVSQYAILKQIENLAERVTKLEGA